MPLSRSSDGWLRREEVGMQERSGLRSAMGTGRRRTRRKRRGLRRRRRRRRSGRGRIGKETVPLPSNHLPRPSTPPSIPPESLQLQLLPLLPISPPQRSHLTSSKSTPPPPSSLVLKPSLSLPSILRSRSILLPRSQPRPFLLKRLRPLLLVSPPRLPDQSLRGTRC